MHSMVECPWRTVRAQDGSASREALRKVLPSQDSRTCAHSEMLGAMLPGIFPDIVPVLVENERRVGLRDPPSALFDLMLELVRSPAGVSKGDEEPCRPSLVADVP